MQRETEINEELTHPSFVVLAERVLTREPKQIREKWSHGALVASVIGVSSFPCGVFVVRDGVYVIDESLPSTTSLVAGLFESVRVVGYPDHTFVALDSPFRTKPIVVEGFDLVVGGTFDGSPSVPYYVYNTLVPSRPSYSVSTLVNKLEALSIADNLGYLIYVSQLGESVRIMGRSEVPLNFGELLDNVGLSSHLRLAYDTLYHGWPEVERHGWE